MKSLEHYKTQVSRAAEDALFLRKERISLRDMLEILAQEKSKYLKMVAVIQFILGHLPAKKREGMKANFYNPEHLPFDPNIFEFKEKIDAGGERDIYLLASKDPQVPSLVLKMYFLVKDSPAEAEKAVKQYRNDCLEIVSWYKEAPHLIPPEYALTLRTPRPPHEPAIVVVQEFLGTDIKDVFDDISEEELMRLFQSDNALRDDFIKFATITLAHEHATGEVVDIEGKRNLVLIEKAEGKKALVFLDPTKIHYTRRNESYETKLKARLKKLEDMLLRAQTMEVIAKTV